MSFDIRIGATLQDLGDLFNNANKDRIGVFAEYDEVHQVLSIHDDEGNVYAYSPDHIRCVDGGKGNLD